MGGLKSPFFLFVIYAKICVKGGVLVKVIIYASEGNVLQQLEICQNYADFYDYDVVGIATEIKTLFKTDIDYDGVIVAGRNAISNREMEYEVIKLRLLGIEKIIIPAVRS